MTAAAAAAVTFAIRLLASRGDLWLDEIISVEIARLAGRPWDIVLAPFARTDNNHLLNTLWLFVVGDAEPMMQRLHSVAAGAASAALACVFALRWGRASALAAATLFAGSFFLINYGSEARGYAMLVCFALSSLALVDRGHERRTPLTTSVFWITCVLGTLSHLLFLQVFVALLAWTVWHLRERRQALIAMLLQYYAIPAGFTAWLYVAFVRDMQILGAEPSDTLTVISQTATYVFGLPRDLVWSRIALAAAAAVVIMGVRLLLRRRDDAWMLLSMLSVGAPAIAMIVTPPAFVLPRYFIVPVVAVLLLAALLLGRLFEQRGRSRIVAAGILIAMLAANTTDTVQLLRYGRGQYTRALRDIVAATPRIEVRIGGDHPFRQRTVVEYHRLSLPPGTAIEYVADDRLREVAPDWVITHSFDSSHVPPSAIDDPFGRGYVLWGTYPSGPLSGWHWHVYRRE